MALPRIPNPFGGTTVPATPAKVYNDLYFASCVINVLTDQPHMSLQFVEFNYDTDEFAPGVERRSLVVPDFQAWANAASPDQSPTLRQQWLGLGIQLGLLELSLSKAQADEAAAQQSLTEANAALAAALAKQADDTAAGVDQATLDADAAAVAAAQLAVDSLAAPLAAVQGAVTAIKAQLHLA